MRYLAGYFIRRLPREGFKSLSVPALALVLVFLINVMGGVKARMEAEYARVLDSLPVYAEISDGDGTAADGLEIGAMYYERFTDPDALWSLQPYVKDVRLKRTMTVLDAPAEPVIAYVTGADDLTALIEDINNQRQAAGVPPEEIMITYYDDLAELISGTGWFAMTALALVSEDLLALADDGVLSITIVRQMGPNQRVQNHSLTIGGTVTGMGKGVVLTTYMSLHYMLNMLYGYGAFPSVGVGAGAKLTHDAAVAPPQLARGTLVGLTVPDTDEIAENGTRIEYYPGYDESLFRSDDSLCLAGEDILAQAENGKLRLYVRSKAEGLPETLETEFTVAGVIRGAEEPVVYAPFSVVSGLAVQSDKDFPHTERLRAALADNRELVAFKDTASRSFSRVGVFFNTRYHAMTIYDAEFYDKTEALLQTIFFLDVTTPFVYAISIGVGFVASFLLTRRRKPEFANMRSVGVNKRDIFLGALLEQFSLCAAGALAGCALFALTWDGGMRLEQSALFLGCYTLGAVFSAARAAGTDVLKILREKE